MARDGDERKDKDIIWTEWTLGGFAAMGVVFLVLFSCYGASKLEAADAWWFGKSWMGLFGTLALVGFASFALGGVLGFLFGIPKSNSGPKSPETPSPASQAPSEKRQFRNNTNLEEISDWLTKIIVGAGLVGLKDLVRSFESIVSRAAVGLVGVPFATMIVGADIVGFAVLGFFTIYLLTRLFLIGAFEREEAKLAEVYKQRVRIFTNVLQNYVRATENQKELLKRVIEGEVAGRPYRLPSDFQQDSPLHQALRSHEERLVICPGEGGPWQPNKTVILTPPCKEIIDWLRSAVQ